eukprot:362979-Chlamydomonas_euryale.AAC.8
MHALITCSAFKFVLHIEHRLATTDLGMPASYKRDLSEAPGWAFLLSSFEVGAAWAGEGESAATSSNSSSSNSSSSNSSSSSSNASSSDASSSVASSGCGSQSTWHVMRHCWSVPNL